MIKLEEISISFTPFKRVKLTDFLLGKKNNGNTDIEKPFTALSKINLKVKEGDRIALIGENGSGKSTLLRIIAGIYKETLGEINKGMRVKCLLDKSFIVSTDLPGVYAAKAEYLMYYGNFEGFNEFLEEIIEFSGLGEFIYKPMSTYSEGMRIRLLFSILTSPFFKYECLALDEAIGTADREFTEKAAKRFKSFIAQSKSLVMASHSSELLKDFCTHGIVLKNGRFLYEGTIDDALNFYEKNYY